MIKDTFKGTGNMKEFVGEFDRMAKALNHCQVRMPRNYKGNPIVLKLEGDSLVLDMTDSEFGVPPEQLTD